MDWFVKFFKQIYNVEHVVQYFGYTGMSAIVFVETGLLIGFFLPGDSLLFTAGLACNPISVLNGVTHLDLLTLNLWLIPAAILGDSAGYWIGYRAGIGMYKREKTLFFRKDHLLRTKEFYEKHGGATIIIARFVPVLRTFAPVVAGIGQMPYKNFIAFNVFGGIGWVLGLSVLGYYLGGIEWIAKHLDITIILVILVSLIPVIIPLAASWLSKKKASPAVDIEGGPKP